MNPRTLLSNQKGVSLIGTLVAVAIGGLVATLLTTIISEAVRGQRAAITRDEASEFALFLKNLLTQSDESCSIVLKGRPFTATTTEMQILNVKYATMGTPPGSPVTLQKGVQVVDRQLEVESLTMEDNPAGGSVRFRTQIDGADTEVERHNIRITLVMKNLAPNPNAPNPIGYRPRYFEIPVLVRPTDNTIVACNNEVNIGDACQNMGFTWTQVGAGYQCVPTSACRFGGAYVTTRGNGCVRGIDGTAGANCGCPPNYTDTTLGTVDITLACQQWCNKGCDWVTPVVNYNVVHQCYICPPPPPPP